MSLFGFGKKKEELKEAACCCDEKSASESKTKANGTEVGVKVLGSGCPRCNAMEVSVKEALAELGMDTAIDHVTDFTKIASYGVMSLPALVVDGKVVSVGKVLERQEAVDILKKVRGGCNR